MSHTSNIDTHAYITWYGAQIVCTGMDDGYSTCIVLIQRFGNMILIDQFIEEDYDRRSYSYISYLKVEDS